MASFARLVVPYALVLAACGNAAPAAQSPHPAVPPAGERCDAACWRSLLGFLAETCACPTLECSTAAGKRMVAWVTTEIIDAQALTPRQSEVELTVELAPYKTVEDACDARFVTPVRARPIVEGRSAAP
jgi:hypothetical protein